MKQQCPQCSKTFDIVDDDLHFYLRLDVPLPTLCSVCRSQRRLVWRNERTLYQRQCDLCKKQIISIYAPQQPFTVYCYECWYSDRWDAQKFGRPIDWNKPFFPQFQALQREVPRLYAMVVDNENSEYTNGSAYNKNCYLIFVSDHNEGCSYSYGIYDSRDTYDCLNCSKLELCYECIGCTNCYDVQYAIDSANCNSASFIIDCKGVQHAFMSYGLRNCEYVWENQHISPKEYQRRLAEIHFDSYRTIQKLKEQFQELKKKHTFKYYHGLNNEQFSGDYIERSRKSFECFESYELENCKFITHGNKIRDCYDCYVTVDQSELCYEIVSGICLYNVKCSYSFWHGRDSMYCDSCVSCTNIFGCVGLRKGNYSILNRVYPEGEYQQLRRRLIEHMKKTREYGEFFPVVLSPFAYNETAAADQFPLKETEVKQRGWRWQPQEQKLYLPSRYRFPDAITTVKDNVTEYDLSCQACRKNFKVLANELGWYRRQNVPLPRNCFDCRHRKRLHDRNPRALWHRRCQCTQPEHDHHGQCAHEFETSYSSENPTLVYCEECYTRSVV